MPTSQNRDMLMEPEDLLGVELTFLPTLWPEETLYSWCARYHRLSGNHLAGDTSVQLFGARTAGFWHDFPSHLGALVERAAGYLPDAAELAVRHTLLGFYVPFRPGGLIQECLAAMTGKSVRDLKFRLGLPASRVGAAHPLKACPACMAEDTAMRGCAIWHVEHQWPTSWLCTVHHIPLQVCMARSKTRNHLQWLLPDDLSREDWWRLPDLPEAEKSFLQHLSRLSAGLISASATVEKSRLRQACLSRLHEKGWLLESGRVDLDAVRDVFLSRTAALARLPGLGFIHDVANPEGGFLGQVLRKDRAHKHPLKQLLVIAFLFESTRDFLDSQKIQSARPDDCCDPINPARDPRRAQLAKLLQTEALSVSEAARRLELPAGKAMYWARKDGLPYRRRPRQLDHTKEAPLREMLLTGVSRDDAATRCHLPLPTVRRYLDTHEDIRLAWQEARLRRERDLYRHQFMQEMTTCPTASIAQLKSRLKPAFGWLVRHDRDWLAAHLPMLDMGKWTP